MARMRVAAADKILGKQVDVLDKGFVRLVDYMGGDARIVQAARVSYGKGTKKKREDTSLINYLIRNRHTSPIEQVELVFHAKMPIFVARQWVRHRTASLNEYSARYSVLPQEFYVPDPDQVRKQSKKNRQGRDEELSPEEAAEFIRLLIEDAEASYVNYNKAVDEVGVSREIARVGLPVGVYTQWYWKIDLHNLMHFLRLRMDSHAQWEIQQYANAMFEMAYKVAPIAMAAFEEHSLNALTLSGSEVELLQEELTRQGIVLKAPASTIKHSSGKFERLGVKLVEQLRNKK